MFLTFAHILEYWPKIICKFSLARSESEYDSLIILLILRLAPFDSYKSYSCEKKHATISSSILVEVDDEGGTWPSSDHLKLSYLSAFG